MYFTGPEGRLCDYIVLLEEGRGTITSLEIVGTDDDGGSFRERRKIWKVRNKVDQI